MTQWEVTSAQALSDAGYATGMWGKWYLGSDPNARSPIDFGFDEAVWCPRTADEVLWTMQSYFPEGEVTASPYAGDTKIPMEPEPIYSRKKGERAETIATYDAKFRAEFDRKITDWAPEVHLQVGPIMQYVTTLVGEHDGEVDPVHDGIQHQNS